MGASEDTGKVQFLIAGVQKGGTTALHGVLQQVPALALSWPKELHFFDDEAVNWAKPDYSPFDGAWPAHSTSVRGEATPIYLYWPESLARAHRYNPDMKVIGIFRDPVERAWSHWLMETGRDADNVPFGWAIREGRARVADSPQGVHRVFSYVERGFYTGQLTRALELFPERQILCLRSEDLKDNPDIVVSRVCEFLGVPKRSEIVPVRANVGPGAEIPVADRAYLADLYQDDLRSFAHISGLNISHWAEPRSIRAGR